MTRKFSEEYKNDAVKMVLENGIKPSQVCKDLGIGRSTIEKWLTNYKSKNQSISVNIDEKEELRQLRAENQRLKLERDLLKKATVFFANDR